MTPTHKVQTLLQIDVPKEDKFVVLHPRVIEAKWTRNNHLIADELTVTIGWKEGGVDPRTVKNARCGFWMWDSNREDFDREKHLRFTGIGKKVHRRLSDQGWVVDITFHDYTTLFINNKPMKSSGMPSYSDTLRQIWERICDNTGWQDPNTDRIISSVAALKPNLIFKDELAIKGWEERTLGEIVPKRFHAIAKPQPKSGASSWDVWQWCVCCLGLISYIDRDTCVITDTTEHYSAEDAALAIYGDNIHSLEESVDTDITLKGILLKSFDPLTGRVLEAFYPPPGDERLKARRAAVGKRSEEGATVTANEQSADYEEFNRYDITDQAALDRAAREAYEERARQEIEGSFKTAEVTLYTKTGDPVDIFDLRAGDAIRVELRPGLRDLLENVAKTSTWGDGSAVQIQYLVSELGYDEDVAELIVANMKDREIRSSVFHVKSIEVDYGPDKFEVDVKYHNLIVVNS